MDISMSHVDDTVDTVDLATSDAGRQVAAFSALGHGLLELPAEEALVEAAALVGVLDAQIEDPDLAGHFRPLFVGSSLAA